MGSTGLLAVLIDVIQAKCLTAPDVGRQRYWIGFLSGLGWEESLLATNFSA